MPRICAVAGCHNIRNYEEKSRSFHAFPKEKRLSRLWLHKCSIKDPCIDPKKAFICSDHFCSTDYLDDLQTRLMPGSIRRRLKQDAVPSMKLPKLKDPFRQSKSASRQRQTGESQAQEEAATSDQEREERRKKCQEERKERQERKERKELVERLLVEHEEREQAALYLARQQAVAAARKKDGAGSKKLKAQAKPAGRVAPHGSVVQAVSQTGAVVGRAVSSADTTPAGPAAPSTATSSAAADAPDDDRSAFADDGGAAPGADDSDATLTGADSDGAPDDGPPIGGDGERPKPTLPARAPTRLVKPTSHRTFAIPRRVLHLRRPGLEDLMLERTKEVMRLKLKVRRLEAKCLRVLRGPTEPSSGAGSGEPAVTAGEKGAEQSAHDGAKDGLPRPQGPPTLAGRNIQDEPLVILRNDREKKLPSIIDHLKANQLPDEMITFVPANIHEAKEANHRLKIQFLKLQATLLKWASKNKVHNDRLKESAEEKKQAAKDARLRGLLRLEAAVKAMFTESQIHAIMLNHEDAAEGVAKEKRRKTHWGEEDLRRTLELRAISSDKVVDHVREKMKIPLPPMRTVKLRCTKSPALSEAYVEMLRKSEKTLNICSMCEGQVKTIDNVIDGANGVDGGGPDVDGEALFGRSFMQLVSERESRHSAGTKPKKRRSAGATATSGAKKRRQSTAALDWQGTSDSDAELSDPGMWGRIPAARPSWQPDLVSSVSTGREPPPPDPLGARHLHKSWR